jgi:hypothetical protein
VGEWRGQGRRHDGRRKRGRSCTSTGGEESRQTGTDGLVKGGAADEVLLHLVDADLLCRSRPGRRGPPLGGERARRETGAGGPPLGGERARREPGAARTSSWQ